MGIKGLNEQEKCMVVCAKVDGKNGDNNVKDRALGHFLVFTNRWWAFALCMKQILKLKKVNAWDQDDSPMKEKDEKDELDNWVWFKICFFLSLLARQLQCS